MDKKAEGQNSDKGAGRDIGRDKPEHDRGADKAQDREQGGGNRGQGSGAGDFRQNAGANREQGSGAGDYGQMAGSKQGVEKTDYHYNQEAEKLAADVKKSGCLPKLFMLLMPLVALGTYMLLRS